MRQPTVQSILKSEKAFPCALANDCLSNHSIRNLVFSQCDTETLRSLVLVSNSYFESAAPHLYATISEDAIREAIWQEAATDRMELYIQSVKHLTDLDGDLFNAEDREDCIANFPNVQSATGITYHGGSSYEAIFTDGGEGSAGRLCGVQLEVEAIGDLPKVLEVLENMEEGMVVRGLRFGDSGGATLAKSMIKPRGDLEREWSSNDEVESKSRLRAHGWFANVSMDTWNSQALLDFKYVLDPLSTSDINQIVRHATDLRTLEFIDRGRGEEGEVEGLLLLKKIAEKLTKLESLTWYIADGTTLPLSRFKSDLYSFPTLRHLQVPWTNRFDVHAKSTQMKKTALREHAFREAIFPNLMSLHLDMILDIDIAAQDQMTAAWELIKLVPQACTIEIASAEYHKAGRSLGIKDLLAVAAETWSYQMLQVRQDIIAQVTETDLKTVHLLEPGWRLVRAEHVQRPCIRFSPSDDVMKFFQGDLSTERLVTCKEESKAIKLEHEAIAIETVQDDAATAKMEEAVVTVPMSLPRGAGAAGKKQEGSSRGVLKPVTLCLRV